MHFNSTQVAIKTDVRLFILVISILACLTTSCSENEIDQNLNDLASIDWKLFPNLIAINNGPVFTVDSIRYDSVSIYRVCSSLRFDSTVVLTGFVFQYWENPNEVKTIREIVVDTVDFAKQGDYVHKARITKLKPNSEYQVSAMAMYLAGKDTTKIVALPASFKTE
jgi:hypothetical protein